MRPSLRTALAACLLLLPLPAARAQLSVLGSTVQEHASTPGQMQGGTLLVANTGAEPRTVRVYLSDYWFDAAGATRYDPPATGARSNAAWIGLEASQVTIPAGATMPVRYSVRTPDTLRTAGSYWSLLMVEPVAPGGAGAGAGQVAVGTVVRYGVQVVNHVGATPHAAAPAVAAEISAPRAAAGAGDTLVVEFDLTNVGEVAYRPALALELIDAEGRSVGTFRRQRGLLYPGTSLRQRFACAGVPRGAYTALVVADAGDDVFGAQVALRW